MWSFRLKIINENNKIANFLEFQWKNSTTKSNDVNIVTTIIGDSSWNAMVAGSKFTEWPDFGTYSKGHIVLQDHGNYVAFRNIKIKVRFLFLFL